MTISPAGVRIAWNDGGFDGMREDERFKTLTGMDDYYEIIPGESIGPFKLGMTRDEIEGLNVRPIVNLEDGAGVYFPLTDAYGNAAEVRFPSPGLYVFYDASGKCGKIEALFSDPPPTFVLSGYIVNEMTTSETISIFNSISPGIVFSYAAIELPSAGLRAIKWESADDFICAIEVVPK